MALRPEVHARLVEMLNEAQEGDKMVRVVQDVMTFLKQHNLVVQMRLSPMHVGVHPCNRDGYGLNSLDVHDLIDSIVDVGFVPGRVGAVGAEIEDDAVRTWNERLVHSAAGLLGTVDGSALKVVSLCGSHTNFALRCFAQQVAHESEHVSISGHLSLERLQKRDPAFHQAVSDGLLWDVIAAPVARAFPELLALVSRSGNASLQRGEHELQVLRRLHASYTRMSQSGENPSFANIKKQVLSSKPACASSVPAMYTFCMKASGGADGALLSETEAYVRSQCPSTRQLGPDMWEALGGECRGQSTVPVAFFRHAVMKLAYLRQCVAVTDVKKMFGKDLFGKVKEADELMTKVRAIVRDVAGAHWLKDPKMIQAMAFQDMAMASMVLGIKVKEEKRWQKIQGVAHDFILLASNITGIQLPSQWAAEAEETKAASDSAAAAGSGGPSNQLLMELNADGTLKEPEKLLEAQGLVVNSFVRRRVEKNTVGKITEIKNDTVYVELASGSRAKVKINDMLQGDWVLHTPKAEAEILKDLGRFAPDAHVDFQAALMVAQLSLRLAEFAKKHGGHDGTLDLRLKPSKMLMATRSIAKGKLLLAPATTKVAHRPASAPAPAASHEVNTPWSLDDRRFWLASSCVLPRDEGDDESQRAKPLVVPFFYVQYTELEGQGNVELQYLADGKFKFPVFKNVVAIKEGDAIMCYKAKSGNKAQPLDMSPQAPKRKAAKDAAAPKKKASKK